MRVRMAYLVPVLALALFISLGGVTHAFASGNGGSPPPDPEVIVPVTLGTLYHGGTENVIYSDSLGSLPDSVSIGEYAVSGPATIAITITDNGYIADYYQLWEDTDPGFSSPAPTLVGTTPQVHTDSNLKAPFYDSLWDGTGTTYSSETFTLSVGSGTTYFVLVDPLFDAMGSALDGPCGVSTAVLLSSGCTVSGLHPIQVSTGFSPGSYYITFNPAVSGVPEFGSTPLLAAAVAIPALMLLKNRRARN
jgi:hypothetical protein